MGVRVLEGGCHCGAIRFRVRAREDRLLDCNCSICRKKGLLHLIVPPEDFELLGGAEAVVEYRFGTEVAVHKHCRTCGCSPFYSPRSHPGWVDVNARCLDEGIEGFVVEPFDGDDWEKNVHRIRE